MHRYMYRNHQSGIWVGITGVTATAAIASLIVVTKVTWVEDATRSKGHRYQEQGYYLLGAPGIATRNKKLLGAPGIATRSKIRGSWPYYYPMVMWGSCVTISSSANRTLSKVQDASTKRGTKCHECHSMGHWQRIRREVHTKPTSCLVQEVKGAPNPKTNWR